MADLVTPLFSWPYPNPDDQLGDLADGVGRSVLAIEDQLRRRYDTSAGSTSITDSTMPGSAGTYVPTTHGATAKPQFTAPPNTNGRVRVHITAQLEVALTATLTAANARRLLLSAGILEGTAASPGASWDGPTDLRALVNGVAGASGTTQIIQASFEWISASLFPGTVYHIQLYKKVSHTTSFNFAITNIVARIFTR